MPNSNVALGPGDYYSPTGGFFSATNWPLIVLRNDFAYASLRLTEVRSHLRTTLPKWATTDRFDIQARTEGNPTRDQMRLMMQSLLADRFKLAIHYETRQLPVFELVLDKPGKLGPHLQAHPDDSPCSDRTSGSASCSAPAPPATVAGGFPTTCGGILPMPAKRSWPRPGWRTKCDHGTDCNHVDWNAGTGVDRPVLDKTGLAGTFDFTLEWTPQLNGPLPPGVNLPARRIGTDVSGGSEGATWTQTGIANGPGRRDRS